MGLLKSLLGLPRWVQIGLGFAAVALAYAVWLHQHDRAVIKDDRAAAAAAANQTARQADAAARTAVDTTRTEVEATNDQGLTDCLVPIVLPAAIHIASQRSHPIHWSLIGIIHSALVLAACYLCCI